MYLTLVPTECLPSHLTVSWLARLVCPHLSPFQHTLQQCCAQGRVTRHYFHQVLGFQDRMVTSRVLLTPIKECLANRSPMPVPNTFSLLYCYHCNSGSDFSVHTLHCCSTNLSCFSGLGLGTMRVLNVVVFPSAPATPPTLPSQNPFLPNPPLLFSPHLSAQWGAVVAQ